LAADLFAEPHTMPETESLRRTREIERISGSVPFEGYPFERLRCHD
jgi:hypothetical protein